ncbi:MAG: chromosomal replication initiator protein DnaA [Chlamydiae bacterium]|nr:chromosomal replication initiator protein DnaA [Chlamydiota bacterium]
MQEWNKLLKELEAKIGAANVNKWLLPLKVVKFDACNLYLEAQNPFHITFFEEQIRPLIKHFVNNNNHPIKIHFISNNLQKNSFNKLPSDNFAIKSDELDPTCSLSSFYPLEENQICYKVVLELIEKEEFSFNPILIHGPSGSGKTHLLMGVAKALLEKGLNVFYVNAQSFTNHVVEAIRVGLMQDFRNTYRALDALIIDDIHIFAKKNATQEELFHTFNTLHSKGSKIILSSNVPTNQLSLIEPRLISRFEWGIPLNLHTPSLVTLKAILLNKVKELNLSFDNTMLEYLLDNFQETKPLQKALQTIVLKSHLNPKPLNLDLIKNYLSPLISEQQIQKITPDKIIQEISNFFGLKTEDVLGKSQTKECVLPRQFSMYFCRKITNLPYIKIGEIFSRDHSTVMTSIKNIQTALESKDKNISSSFQELSKLFDKV